MSERSLCAVGRTPWSAVDPLVDLFRFWNASLESTNSNPRIIRYSEFFQGPSRSTRGSTADQGVRPTVLQFSLVLLFALNASAAVDGVVVNQTTGKPQAGATVTLYKVSAEGPTSLESVKSAADGKFTINQEPAAGVPHLLQAAFDGVTYNKMLPPGMPSTGLMVNVYNSTPQRSAVKITQHMILLEPSATELSVKESFFYKNDGKTTWNDSTRGNLRFEIPAGSRGNVEVNATAPQGMPIRRAPEKTDEPGVMKVDFPVKPGETRIDLSYKVDFKSPGKFSGRSLEKAESTMMAIPAGVEVKGEGIEDRGKEPSTQASIFSVIADKYTVEMNGTGELGSGSTRNEDDGPEIQVSPARVMERKYYVVGLAGAILLLSFLRQLQKKA